MLQIWQKTYRQTDRLSDCVDACMLMQRALSEEHNPRDAEPILVRKLMEYLHFLERLTAALAILMAKEKSIVSIRTHRHGAAG